MFRTRPSDLEILLLQSVRILDRQSLAYHCQLSGHCSSISVYQVSQRTSNSCFWFSRSVKVTHAPLPAQLNSRCFRGKLRTRWTNQSSLQRGAKKQRALQAEHLMGHVRRRPSIPPVREKPARSS